MLQYNQDDCRTLKRIVEFMRSLAAPDSSGGSVSQIPFKSAETDDLIKGRPHWDIFRPREYASEDFKKVARCAYFDYQRELGYVRSHPPFKIVNNNHTKFKRDSIRVNKAESIASYQWHHRQTKKTQHSPQP